MTGVLFWDIDGTLLTTARAGMFAWQDAAGEVIGRPVDVLAMPTAGLTDIEVAVQILRAHGVEASPPALDRLVHRYETLLPDRLGRRPGRVLPGVREILEALRGRADILSLLLTGNTRAGARAKLTYYGLDAYFDGGAFADDAPDRLGIARRALALAAERLNGLVRPDCTYVIGDTPLDIQCGKAIGARTIAVESGTYSAADLAPHEPWCVLRVLPAPAEFLYLLGVMPRRASAEL